MKKPITVSELKRAVKKLITDSPPIKAKRKKYIKRIRDCYDYSQSTPTLLCSNCGGGMMFHNLGLKFMSPTVNLWLVCSDFVKFVCNLDKYLNTPLHFIESSYDYPVARLDDITVYFTHYLTEEDAEAKWNERKKRIDRDNMYVITDDNRLSDDDIKSLLNLDCKRVIIFTTNPERGDGFFIYRTCRERYPFYSVRDMSGFAPFEREFNYAAWLSGGTDLRI